ncbi:hypothetical protein WME76_09225 [Sorangium sp. So ce119]|uniref:hypothetical protein n=1 Tax=Sorangium sp. So ce119 TaxID=3133279 RepID=UPI003F644591
MISVAVKIETACGTCRMPMPVNTLAGRVSCPTCGRPTSIANDLWQALLREPLYNGQRLLPKEVRRSSAGKLSVAYIRRAPSCQGCETEIPAASIGEVLDQAMLRCDRCAVQTWVRAVPTDMAGALPNITHLVGEAPTRLAGAPAPQAEPATFPCPQCGSPIAFDGVSRACMCRFCGASVHVPDEFVYRGQRKVVAHWYLCFHPSVTVCAPAAQAVAAGLFDWEELPEAAVDAEGNLYCAATQSRWFFDENGRLQQKIDHMLWSLDPSLSIRWLQRDRPEPVRFLGCVKDMLVVLGAGSSPPLRLSSTTGNPVEDADFAAPSIELAEIEHRLLACSPDGSLLFQKDGKLRRVAPGGAELPVWPNSAPRNEADDEPPYSLNSIADCPVTVPSSLTGMHFGPDSSLYLQEANMVARFDATGRKVYCVELGSNSADRRSLLLGADLDGRVYVIRSDRLVQVGAAGGQNVVLLAERDALPRARMTIAACPDGSFWLFGEKGLAWKFAPGGRLLFASEKEPRPKNPTVDEVVQQHVESTMEMLKVRGQAEVENMQRVEREVTRRENVRESRIFAVSWTLGLVFIVALVIAIKFRC